MNTVDEQILAVEALEVLWNDLGDTRRALESDLNNQRLRRHLFYDFCVYIEASVDSTKRTIVVLDDLLREGCFRSTNTKAIEAICQLFDFEIERETLSVLAGLQGDVNQNGSPKIRQRFIPRLTDVRFAYRMYAQAFRLDLKPDFSSAGWSAFCEVITCRNRITHPSNLKDLEISDSDINNLVVADNWFRDDLSPLMKAGTARLEEIRDASRDLFISNPR